MILCCLIIILMLICGVTGLMVGYVLGADRPKKKERSRKDEQR